MPDFGFERSLLLCLLINTAVFGSACFFAARRLTLNRLQALLDAALLWYAVQYVSVGLAGLLGILDCKTVCGIASLFVLGFVAGGWNGKRAPGENVPLRGRLIPLSIAVFVVGFTLAFAHSQADLPVISNDAMTYHFPAAAQWLQQGRIGYFQTWFFNPANTYSPLAGSIFIAWLMLPFGNDLLARFAEVPALLCVGLAIYRLCRLLGCRISVAAILTAAAILSRPIFTPCMMGKDDLLVAFFFTATLIALAPDRSGRRFAAVRLGLALGLLLATKYTVLLSAPILLLAIDGPCWKRRGWIIAGVIALLLGGPWYLHNWIATGSPIFPLALPHIFRGLFTAAAGETLHDWRGARSILLGDQYGMPMALICMLGMSMLICMRFFIHPFGDGPAVIIVTRASGPCEGQKTSDISTDQRPAPPARAGGPCHDEGSGAVAKKVSLLRACALGPILALALFYWRSPFPEVRFLLPMFLLLFACACVAIDRLCRNEKFAIAVASMVLGTSLYTLFSNQFITASFMGIGLAAASVVLAACLWAGQRRLRQGTLAAAGILGFGIFTYINGSAYCRNYLAMQHASGSADDQIYPELNQLWAWVDRHVPGDATVAYTNQYLVYPLQGPALQRRVVYAPTRAGIHTIADLPWLGDHLPGEAIVPAAVRETVAASDRNIWLENLKQLRCEYLVVARAGHGGVIRDPPERAFAEMTPGQLTPAFSCEAGNVYRIHWQ